MKLDTGNDSVVSFIEGISHVDFTILKLAEYAEDNYLCPVCKYTCDKDKMIHRFRLYNESSELSKVIFVGTSYEIYLLNNSGKTIEKLN
jgi:hypothetical protein